MSFADSNATRPTTDAGQPRNMTFELDAAHPQAMTQVLALRLKPNHSRATTQTTEVARVCSVRARAVLPVELDGVSAVVLRMLRCVAMHHAQLSIGLAISLAVTDNARALA